MSLSGVIENEWEVEMVRIEDTGSGNNFNHRVVIESPTEDYELCKTNSVYFDGETVDIHGSIRIGEPFSNEENIIVSKHDGGSVNIKTKKQ